MFQFLSSERHDLSDSLNFSILYESFKSWPFFSGNSRSVGSKFSIQSSVSPSAHWPQFLRFALLEGSVSPSFPSVDEFPIPVFSEKRTKYPHDHWHQPKQWSCLQAAIKKIKIGKISNGRSCFSYVYAIFLCQTSRSNSEQHIKTYLCQIPPSSISSVCMLL